MHKTDGSAHSSGSAGSLLSIGSSGSILSIGSAGSILSIGSAGSVLSIGSVGSVASAFSIGSAASVGSILSGLSRWSVLAWRSAGITGLARRRAVELATARAPGRRRSRHSRSAIGGASSNAAGRALQLPLLSRTGLLHALAGHDDVDVTTAAVPRAATWRPRISRYMGETS
jgi:hypothetical protein